jgi:hypothetical protein
MIEQYTVRFVILHVCIKHRKVPLQKNSSKFSVLQTMAPKVQRSSSIKKKKKTEKAPEYDINDIVEPSEPQEVDERMVAAVMAAPDPTASNNIRVAIRVSALVISFRNIIHKNIYHLDGPSTLQNYYYYSSQEVRNKDMFGASKLTHL